VRSFPKKRSAPKLDIPRVWAARDALAASWLWTDCSLIPDATPPAACWVADRTSLPKTPELRARALAFTNACKTKDWRLLADLLKSQAEEQARSCDVSLAPQKEDVFTQRDENTWTRTVEGACGAIVYTLWRRRYTDQHWNFT